MKSLFSFLKLAPILLIAFTLALSACAAVTPAPIPTQSSPTAIAKLPNPASVHCEQQGNRLEIRTAADGSQNGVCVFPDGSECDEWSYLRGQCGLASQAAPTMTQTIEPTVPAPTEIPTPLPVILSDTSTWWKYTHSTYGFSILLPEDWIVEETTASDPLMNGHLILLHPEKDIENFGIRMTFRKVGEDTLLWPTGVGSGKFVSQGTLDVAGKPVRRVYFVCPAGQVNSIRYHDSETEANIRRGDLEFGLIYTYNHPVYCQEGSSLGGKVELVGEMIIASLKVP
jgi:uncharacterized protein